MNNFIRKLACSLMSVALLSAGQAMAAPTPVDNTLCRPGGVAMLYFNGVFQTKEEADIALQELKAVHGTATSHGEQIRYEALYSYTDGSDVLVELFRDTLAANNGPLAGRFELFFSALRGGGQWWSSITKALPSTEPVLDTTAKHLNDASVAQMLVGLLSDNPAIANIEHRTRLDNLALEGKKLMMVGYSVGNLRAKRAYNYGSSKLGPQSVKVVHIAPINGSDLGPRVLADKDEVVHALKFGGYAHVDTDLIDDFGSRPAGVAGQQDRQGHGLLEIYLNKSLPTSARVKDEIDYALDTLVTPAATATSGFISATLTWDGAGDVDLHVDEPDGTHVFYGSTSGRSGALDVDNMVANGPEHYYASCDGTQLQTGTYKFSLANYSGAQGRTATVQIASWNDGVLGTKQFLMGEATRNDPSVTLFRVVVTKDAQGVFQVSMASDK